MISARAYPKLLQLIHDTRRTASLVFTLMSNASEKYTPMTTGAVSPLAIPVGGLRIERSSDGEKAMRLGSCQWYGVHRWSLEWSFTYHTYPQATAIPNVCRVEAGEVVQNAAWE